MPARLTETAIAKAMRDVAALGERRDLSDAGCPGLRLRLTPAGAEREKKQGGWVLACRDREGRMRRFPVGTYPTMGLADARDAARLLHAKVRHDGADPVADRRRDRAAGIAAKAGEGTLAALLEIYTAKAGSRLKSWPEGRKRVELVFKPLLSRPLTALKVGDFQLMADRYHSAMSGAFAVRTLRPVLRWAAAPGRGYVPRALSDLQAPVGVTRRKRVLTRNELAALLPTLRASCRPYASAMRFMLLTLARRDEACTARWCDVDLSAGTWTIPETKNGEPHVVPLSRQAAELLRTVRPPVAKSDELVFRTKSGGKLPNWDRETKAIQAASGTEGWHRHDLRRTGATMLGEIGELPDIIEAALNHTSIRSPLAATYNRSRYRPQVAAALQRLADALDGIEDNAALVVPLRSRAAS